MHIAFVYNLRLANDEEEAEFDPPETVDAVYARLEGLGHKVDRIDVSGPPSQLMTRLEALTPDLVFNIAEGRSGRSREAYYPALFEQLGLPYTGSDASACTITADKQLAKRLLADAGVPVLASRLVRSPSDAAGLASRLPAIVKPNYEGSSKGISQASVVETSAALEAEVAAALKRFPDGVLVEEYVEGRDVSLIFLEAARKRPSGLLEPVEFFPPGGPQRRYPILDYEAKNGRLGRVRVEAPARLAASLKTALTEWSAKAVSLLGLRDYGRVDFRLSGDGRAYFLEANALTDLAPGSSIYAAAARAGFGTEGSVIRAIVESAAFRFGIRQSSAASRRSRVLKVGFTYNEKRIKPQADPNTDTEAEFDSDTTLSAVRDAIRSYGHEVVNLEATPELPGKLASTDVDLVFNIAEGIRGRNRESQVPALLELLGIPYTGSDATTLAITLDKGLAKRIVREEGVLTPRFLLMTTGKERLPEGFRFPVIAKPVGEGSSKGVLPASVVDTPEALAALVRGISERYRQPALVEEYLPGREFTLALLGEKRPRVLPPMEIAFGASAGALPVYAYEHKLSATDAVTYVAPAKVDEKLKRELEKAARKSFLALGCRDVARIDLRLDSEGRPNFIECNPLPGLTPGWSDLCMIAESAKMDYRTLIGEILAPAIRRYKEKNRLLLGGSPVRSAGSNGDDTDEGAAPASAGSGDSAGAV